MSKIGFLSTLLVSTAIATTNELSAADCKRVVARVASLGIGQQNAAGTSPQEEAANEQKIQKICHDELGYQRCDFFGEALAVGKAGTGFKSDRFCNRFIVAVDNASLMEEILDSGSVKELAYGKCMLKRQDPVFCTNFHVQFHQAVEQQEIDCLRTSYMLKLTGEDAVAKTVVGMPINDAGDHLVAAVGANKTIVSTNKAVVVKKPALTVEKSAPATAQDKHTTPAVVAKETRAPPVAAASSEKKPTMVENKQPVVADKKPAVVEKTGVASQQKKPVTAIKRPVLMTKLEKTKSKWVYVKRVKKDEKENSLRALSENLKMLTHNLLNTTATAKVTAKVPTATARKSNLISDNKEKKVTDKKVVVKIVQHVSVKELLKEHGQKSAHDHLIGATQNRSNRTLDSAQNQTTSKFHGFLSAFAESS